MHAISIALTAENIKTVKRKDLRSVVFRLKDSKHTLEFWHGKENEYKAENHTEIQVNGMISDYGQFFEDQNRNLALYEAVHSETIYKNQPDHVSTFLGFLKAGDMVSLYWIADNNNQYVKNVELHADTLRVMVTRGKKRFTFEIQTSVCPENSARMIKRSFKSAIA